MISLKNWKPMPKSKNDFNKLFCFVKGVLISAEVIKASNQALRHEVKYHFNQVLASCKMFEKHMHNLIGDEYAEMEDDINGSLIGIIWSIYEMSPDAREAFITHMEKFNYEGDTEFQS